MTASAQDRDAGADRATDGSVDTAWTTKGGAGVWIQLAWPVPQALNGVVLRDRADLGDTVLRGTLTFDDGSAVQVGALPDDGSPLLVHFPTRSSTTVRFTVSRVAPGATSVGLAELSVLTTSSEDAPRRRPANVPVAVPCPAGTVLNVVAHADDDLFFISPHVHQRVGAGACLRTVVLTAGDNGLGTSYWRSREEGLHAAYATISGVPNAWTRSRLDLDGYFVDLDVLVAESRVSLVFLRLPDGNLRGEGFPATGHVSLGQLWDGRAPALTSLDHGLTLTSDQLVQLLRDLISVTGPTEINTLDPRSGTIDHDDHQYAARYAIRAVDGVRGAPRPTSYEGYTTSTEPTNVAGADLAAKKDAFFAYAPFDRVICQNEASCASRPDGSWFARQYVVPR